MASNQWYVDPVSGDNANGGTSDGDAWATFQYALSNLTQSTTDGDYINLKSNGTHNLTANVNWSVVTLSAAYPILVRGYESTAGDGVAAVIDLKGYKYSSSNSYNYLKVRHVNFTNSAGSHTYLFFVGSDCLFMDCKFYNMSGFGYGYDMIRMDSTTSVRLSLIRCQCINMNHTLVLSDGVGLYISGCYFDGNAVSIGATGGTHIIRNSIFNLSGGIGLDISVAAGIKIINNTFLSSSGGTAIKCNSSLSMHIENNIIEGFSKGVDSALSSNYTANTLMNNYFYNNTTDVDATTYRQFLLDEGNYKSAGSSVLTKTGSATYDNRIDYFSPLGDAIGGAADGMHDIGALPAVSGGSGGGLIRHSGMDGGING